MTPEAATSGGQRNTELLSLPEQVQLYRAHGDGHLDYGYFDLSTAALVELALAGRIVARPGVFGPSWSIRLHVINTTPTGDPVVDGVLIAMAAKSPRSAFKSVKSLAAATAASTALALETRGIVSVAGGPKQRGGHLVVVDTDTQRRVIGHLNSALLKPETVSDPRIGALADVFQRSGNPWTGDRPDMDAPIGPWYDDDVRATVNDIMHGLNAATGIAT